jgi:hypothetical protein
MVNFCNILYRYYFSFFLHGMAQARHYRGLNTNLDNLYNTIKQVLEDEKNLIISQEFN